jgi:hypothetical protein
MNAICGAMQDMACSVSTGSASMIFSGGAPISVAACNHADGRLTDCSKIRSGWKTVIIFDHPRRILSLTDVREPRRNFAVRNSSTREPWLFRSPGFGSGIRRLDGEAVGGRLTRTPPRRITLWLATSINRTTGSSTPFSRG